MLLQQLLPSTTPNSYEIGPCHKSLPTCTVSLAHAEVVCEMDKSQDMNCAPQLSVHRAKPIRAPYRPNEISVIPFPTTSPESTLPSPISSRPLPLPPKTHALLRTTHTQTRMTTTDFDFAAKRTRKTSLSPLSPKAKFVALPMQRRRSRDPNVADRLVVELDDEDHRHTLPPRPSSPSPELQGHAARGQHSKTKSESDIPTSPDQVAPPAYSTLPPPYTAATDEKSNATIVVLEKEEHEHSVSQSSPRDKPSLPAPRASNSSSSASSSSKRTRVSTSELRVLVFLYRTVVYGLEMRSRSESGSSTSDLKPPSSSLNTPRPASPTKKKPLGPRSSPSASPTLREASLIPPPEDKFHFESALAAASAKAKRVSTYSQSGFAQFPLVEDDLDSDKDSEAREYVTPRTPFHSPSQSPRSSPPPFLRPSPSLDAVASHFASSSKPKKEKAKAEINAELHVQDALLALRLKEFLRAQGVCEDDLRVDFDDEGKMVEAEKVERVDEVKKESVIQVQQEENEESNILEEYFMGIEEEDHSGLAMKDRGPVVEDDDDIVQTKLDSPFVEEDDLNMDMDDSFSSSVSSASSPPTVPSPPPPTLQIATLAQRVCSPPPASPSPRPHAVLPTSYMVAFLTMRNRHPSKRPGSSLSSSNSTSGIPVEKGKESKVKRKSGLSVVVEVD